MKLKKFIIPKVKDEFENQVLVDNIKESLDYKEDRDKHISFKVEETEEEIVIKVVDLKEDAN